MLPATASSEAPASKEQKTTGNPDLVWWKEGLVYICMTPILVYLTFVVDLDLCGPISRIGLMSRIACIGFFGPIVLRLLVVGIGYIRHARLEEQEKVGDEETGGDVEAKVEEGAMKEDTSSGRRGDGVIVAILGKATAILGLIAFLLMWLYLIRLCFILGKVVVGKSLSISYRSLGGSEDRDENRGLAGGHEDEAPYGATSSDALAMQSGHEGGQSYDFDEIYDGSGFSITITPLHSIPHHKTPNPPSQATSNINVKMQFAILASVLALTTTTSALAASGIFSIAGSGTGSQSSSSVTLQVLNGRIGDAPKCSGTVHHGSPLPAQDTIPCVEGYALSFSWPSLAESLTATYTTPQNTFTYNVPNQGCNGNVCEFGFTDYFPEKKVKALRV
ncbi:uncharacterized protein L3040_000971 [Drepanopeziza brunnea f. sp. 'multigermtubi']|uniref:uncharacterized protein n=1 Tax=Drepanopeziza brunnea f. sp. 'multigermtubi' TaxID=698441 RepID=UPI00239EB00D|nr:hypothetical protein L3040_000971 [Drepanopeziza brunnea f. sp. 'multigermtubi']